MTFAQSRFRQALLIALFAICAQALLPTLMRWQQSVDPVGMAEICTVFGIQAPSGDAEGAPEAQSGHCPWCVAQAAWAIPVTSSHAVFARHAEVEVPPTLLSPDRPSLSPLAPAPRAPPRHV
jgi:hypothetical protein